MGDLDDRSTPSGEPAEATRDGTARSGPSDTPPGSTLRPAPEAQLELGLSAQVRALDDELAHEVPPAELRERLHDAAHELLEDAQVETFVPLLAARKVREDLEHAAR